MQLIYYLEQILFACSSHRQTREKDREGQLSRQNPTGMQEKENGSGEMREEQAGGMKRPIGYSSNDDDNDGDDNQPMSDAFRRSNSDDERCRAAIKLIPPANWYLQFLSLAVPTIARQKIIAARLTPMLLRVRNDSRAADYLTILRVRHNVLINVALQLWSDGFR